MLVNAEKIMVNDSLCYQVRQRNTAPWEPFCGVLDNFYFISGYEREVIVKKYDPHADTMFVIVERSRKIPSSKIKKRNIQARKRMGMQTNNNDSVQTTPTSNGE